MTTQASSVEKKLKVLTKGDNSMFIPRSLETVKYEGKSIQAYSIVSSDDPAAERIFALMLNRAAAENAFLPPLAEITFFASRC